MPAILTITFNPCIDLYTAIPALRPGSKLRCATPRSDPGGGGINVARAITKLGGEAVALYPAGGSNGKQLSQMLNEEGVPSIVVEIAGDTRQNLIITDNATGLQYQFNMPGPVLEETSLKDMLAIIRKQEGIEFLVISGSLAPGMTGKIFDELTAIAEKKKIRLIVDTPGESLKEAVKRGVYLIKPSIHELIALSEKSGKERLIEDLAKELIACGQCVVVVVSMGAAGALLVTKEGVRHVTTPAVKIQGTVGAGDSMVAGIVWSLHNGKPLDEAVAYGCICGAAATLHPGTSLCSREDVELLMKIK